MLAMGGRLPEQQGLHNRICPAVLYLRRLLETGDTYSSSETPPTTIHCHVIVRCYRHITDVVPHLHTVCALRRVGLQ